LAQIFLSTRIALFSIRTMSTAFPVSTGSFTLPGEAVFEQLTLRLAKKWGRRHHSRL
jgi:hypothetical protein